MSKRSKNSNRRQKSRIYWREQGGQPRAYADFRDIGGGREELICPGESRATTDPEIAERLASDRLRELQEERRDRTLYKVRRRETLQSLVAMHLVKKATANTVGVSHLAALQQRLDTAIAFFGEKRNPA